MRRVIRSTDSGGSNDFFRLIRNLVNTFAGIIESFLFIRILLKLFGANEGNVFVDFIYSISAFFLRPFNGLFSDFEVQEGMILEINTLVAMIVYAVIAALIISIFSNFTRSRVKEEYVDVE